MTIAAAATAVNRMPLHERYRPHDLAGVIGQPRAVETIRTLADRGLIGGRAFWLSGKSGQGKTTLARIIAGFIADPFHTLEFDAADDFTAAAATELARDMQLYALGRGGRAWIINEAHGLRAPVIRKLLGILERLPAHVTVIFTTTRDGEDGLFEDQIDAHPLLSRCTVIPLTSQGFARPAAEQLQTVAEAENLNGQPLAAYTRLINECRGNLRRAYTEIEAGRMLAAPSPQKRSNQ